MGYAPDQWAKDWLAKRRAADPEAVKGWTVEKRGDSHIVRKATTVWDSEAGKRRKVGTEYLGVLEPDGTLVEKRPQSSYVEVSRVVDSGSAKLLAKAAEPVLEALRAEFPSDYREILLLAETRLLDRGELSKAGRCWGTIEDVLGLKPNTSAKSLSDTLERVGASKVSQDGFFGRLATGERRMAVDMSVIFSRARGATLVKKGYNRFRLSCTQLNIVVGCGMESGRPQYLKAVPGNVKEGSAREMLDEFAFEEGTVLVMDRGYHDKKLLAEIRGRGLGYLVAVKRNSAMYREVEADQGMFVWRGSAVRYGVEKVGDEWVYRFENLNQRNDEIVDGLMAVKSGKRRSFDDSKAGNFVMVSSVELDPETAYSMYKARCAVENFFDSAKDVLSADRTYMHDDAHLAGFMFVTFVAALMRFWIADRIRDAGLSSSWTPEDVLDTYATMKCLSGKGTFTQTVPKDVKDLDARLKVFLYSDQGYLDRLNKVPKKRGRKPKAANTS